MFKAAPTPATEARTGSMSGSVLDSVQALEEKIQAAQNEKEQLIARARTASTTEVNEMLGDVGTSSGSQAFGRMKEKTEMLETRAK
eukprot:736100-Prorocentrum_lima.AAC.1